MAGVSQLKFGGEFGKQIGDGKAFDRFVCGRKDKVMKFFFGEHCERSERNWFLITQRERERERARIETMKPEEDHD